MGIDSVTDAEVMDAETVIGGGVVADDCPDDSSAKESEEVSGSIDAAAL